MIETYSRPYLDQVRAFSSGDRDDEFSLTLENTDGALHEALVSAQMETRIELLESNSAIDGEDRRFTEGGGARRLDAAEEKKVLEAYERYLETIPERKRQHSVSYQVKDVVGRKGFGIGSAGLPAFNLLIEGPSQALENDVMLSMKQGNVAAPSRVVTDEKIAGYFQHHGHRTAVSQRALQAHADPWVGWAELDGVGQVVQEISPYTADIDWDAVTDVDEILPLLRYLGQATAKVHCVSDAGL